MENETKRKPRVHYAREEDDRAGTGRTDISNKSSIQKSNGSRFPRKDRAPEERVKSHHHHKVSEIRQHRANSYLPSEFAYRRSAERTAREANPARTRISTGLVRSRRKGKRICPVVDQTLDTNKGKGPRTRSHGNYWALSSESEPEEQSPEEQNLEASLNSMGSEVISCRTECNTALGFGS